MLATAPALVFDTLPWWLATPLLYLGLLTLGMALDETYVNRTTVLTGSLALAVQSVANDGLWFPLAVYLDVGLVVGAYGLYAYVVDAYVPNWFRVLAYFLYSPVSILLVLLLPDVVFIVALAIAAYLNLQLLATLHPVEPYYFGPESDAEFADAAAETGEPAPVRRDDVKPGEGLSGAVADATFDRGDRQRSKPGGESDAPAEADPDSIDRGVLPNFMRRI